MKKLIKSFSYAMNGICDCFKTERNIKIHSSIGFLALCGCLFLKVSAIEWVAVLLAIALVIGAEMMNTSIERLVNLVSPTQHPLAGNVKDIAAGAVLFCAICSFLIGAIIFSPKLWALLAAL